MGVNWAHKECFLKTPGRAGIVGKQDVSEVQEKHKVLNLGLNNPRAQNRLESAGWEEQLEGSW